MNVLHISLRYLFFLMYFFFKDKKHPYRGGAFVSFFFFKKQQKREGICTEHARALQQAVDSPILQMEP